MKIAYFGLVESGPAPEWRAAVLALSLVHNAGVAPEDVRLHAAGDVGAAFRAFAADHGLVLTFARDGRPDPAAFADCDRVVVCETDVFASAPLPAEALAAPAAAADGSFRVLDAARLDGVALPTTASWPFLRYGEGMDACARLPGAGAAVSQRLAATLRVLADPSLFRLFEAWQDARSPVAPMRIEAALAAFRNPRYLRHNARRLEHLAALRLDLEAKSVLEFGAGVGDHSQFFLDRGCHVVAIEPRAENVACMRARYAAEHAAFPRARHMAILADAEGAAAHLEGAKFQIVHNYGLLYHLDRPEAFLRQSADYCEGLYLLETAVSDLTESEPAFTEDGEDFTHAIEGRARLLSRADIFATLRESLPYVYMPRAQPAHEQFLKDWTAPPQPRPHRHRAVFIASTTPLADPGLADAVLARHVG